MSKKSKKQEVKLYKFKEAPPLTDAEIAEMRAQVFELARLSALAESNAKALFAAYRRFNDAEFIQYLEEDPPSSWAIASLVAIAEAADNPRKPSQMGKAKDESLYGPTRQKVLAAWQVNLQSEKPRTKGKFAEKLSQTLKYPDHKNTKGKIVPGKDVPYSTIYRWLPKKKKKKL